jgi:hypothetical protein
MYGQKMALLPRACSNFLLFKIHVTGAKIHGSIYGIDGENLEAQK